MKRFWAFTAVFPAALLIGYLEPVFFPAEKPTKTAQNRRLLSAHTAVPHEGLPVSDYAAYTGKDVGISIRQFGNPEEEVKAGRTYELWTFSLAMNDYLEVNVRENRVITIKAFNNDEMMELSEIDMELIDLSDLMTIYSNFASNFHHEAYDVELIGEDMNYRPLVASGNGSFAALFFNQRTGGLVVVSYVSKETLLAEMSYQLNEGSPLPVDITRPMTSGPVQSNQAIYVMNLAKQ